LYNEDSKDGSIIRWRCQNRACRGALFLNNENEILRCIVHNHPPVPEKVNRLRVMNSIRDKAADTHNNVNSIIREHLQTLSDNDNIETLQFALCKRHNKENKK
jgi:hypothetical protein